MASRLIVFVLLFCSSAWCEQRFEFVGDVIIPEKHKHLEESFGGLSGMTYDSINKKFYAISDDWGPLTKTRAYEFLIEPEKREITNIRTIYLKGASNFDGEGIAWQPHGKFFVSSEGIRKLGLTIDPKIYAYSFSGQQLFELPVPEIFWNEKKKDYGMQSNQGFEALCLSQDRKKLYTANEEALLQELKTQKVRVQEYDLETRKPTRQFTYSLAHPENGLTELIHQGDKKFLALERRFNKQEKRTYVSLFSADCEQTPCTKKLVFDADQLREKFSKNYQVVDNLEGMTFGDDLPGGGKWFYLISDNNFQASQRNQLLIFRWFPR
jgi:hypothetical protein